MTTVRPLRGEPLAVDLLNTTWMQGGAERDWLANDEGLAGWLEEWSFDAPVDEPTRTALVEARRAIRAVLSDPTDPAAIAALNQVLDRGRTRTSLAPGGRVERTIDTTTPEWRPGVTAAHHAVELLESRPDRVRQCQHDECVLWFVDTSRNGTRRWCSMAACGNRAKASRHYDRHRSGS